MNRKGFSLLELLICTAIVVILGTIALQQFGFYSYGIDPTDFSRMMAQEGIQNAQQGPYRYGACSNSDQFNSSFTGVKNGVPVNGVICAGWGGSYGKAMTVRYF